VLRFSSAISTRNKTPNTAKGRRRLAVKPFFWVATPPKN
jgi:hypothetical protein